MKLWFSHWKMKAREKAAAATASAKIPYSVGFNSREKTEIEAKLRMPAMSRAIKTISEFFMIMGFFGLLFFIGFYRGLGVSGSV